MSKKLERNDPCWCGSGKKYKNCHMRFDEKIHGFELEGHIVPGHDIIKTPEQIEGIRESGKVNIAVLDYVAENICAGISTEQINKWVDDKTANWAASRLHSATRASRRAFALPSTTRFATVFQVRM